MTKVFDGKNFAKEKESQLIEEVKRLKKKGTVPKLVSILAGNDPASRLYVNLKKKAAERVGAEVKLIELQKNEKTEKLKNFINISNADKSVHGIMVQLPLPENFSKKDREEIIDSITKEKDVDGLRDDSPYLTPTVKAVLEVIKEATSYIVRLPSREHPHRVCVVGYKGFEGSKIYNVLREMGYEVDGADLKTENLKLKTKKADILISATGVSGLITGDMVKDGAVVIDIGAPKADVVTSEIMDKASFISPVPGGVGPVTISCLLENLVEASE